MPRVCQIHINYEMMENQLRTTQDMLATEQENHRETRELVSAFNTQIQAFMVVKNNKTLVYNPTQCCGMNKFYFM
jgi:hypothetical protein